MKNLADLNTFETSISLRDRVKASIKTLIPCLFTYVHTLPSSGSKVLRSYNKHQQKYHNDISGKHSTVLKGPSFGLKVRLQCLSFFTTTSLLLFWLKEPLLSCPGVDMAVVLLIG